MFFSDMHIHTSFSSDSDADIECVIKRAIELGLKEIAITDHIDFDYPDFNYPFLFDYEQYSKKLEYVKNKYSDRITVKKGVEMGLQPEKEHKIKSYFNDKNFDFVIGSTHCVDGLELYGNFFYKGKTKHEAYTIYFERLLENVKTFDCYNVYGHIDYVNRYGGYDNNTLDYKLYSDIIDEILKEIISRGKGIEVNTSGLKYGLGYVHPLFPILKRYRELGGEIITLGSDAHSPQYVAFGFDEGYEALKAAGFKAITSFENMQPTFVDI